MAVAPWTPCKTWLAETVFTGHVLFVVLCWRLPFSTVWGFFLLLCGVGFIPFGWLDLPAFGRGVSCLVLVLLMFSLQRCSLKSRSKEKEELKLGLKRLGISTPTFLLETFLERLDADDSGRVELREARHPLPSPHCVLSFPRFGMG